MFRSVGEGKITGRVHHRAGPRSEQLQFLFAAQHHQPDEQVQQGGDPQDDAERDRAHPPRQSPRLGSQHPPPPPRSLKTNYAGDPDGLRAARSLSAWSSIHFCYAPKRKYEESITPPEKHHPTPHSPSASTQGKSNQLYVAKPKAQDRRLPQPPLSANRTRATPTYRTWRENDLRCRSSGLKKGVKLWSTTRVLRVRESDALPEAKVDCLRPSSSCLGIGVECPGIGVVRGVEVDDARVHLVVEHSVADLEVRDELLERFDLGGQLFHFRGVDEGERRGADEVGGAQRG
ncbi:hypothetical protein BDK51DRAFT_49943 [Blyttiomyces helicus]|uniref:Uncharacterized protein n=1 Tax=Blyttiomyces helicus TaxID=388810 RepID=A0A4P9WH66_9FUNG|nr:hypothetical protein BDK51DRAFT_49943 [Blyttiomyces helicus]|eukprot:RKO89866.1 hypothetical protein BDK51DRAFT_49943 [Blyttiomyces helicus]